MKKIALVCVIIAVMATMLTVVSSAVVLPSGDLTNVALNMYYAPVDTNENSGYYPIRGFSSLSSSIGQISALVNKRYGLIRYFAIDEKNDGTYEYKLQGIVSLVFTKSNDFYSCEMKYTIAGQNEGNIVLFQNLAADYDFIIVVANDGRLSTITYNELSGLVSAISMNAPFPLYGLVNAPGQTGDTDPEALQEAFDQGYNSGLREGFVNGENSVTGTIPSIRENAFNEGKAEGIIQGREEALEDMDEAIDYWYNLGKSVGQNTDEIVSTGIIGFFEGITGFFNPFFSLGIGSLTVGTLLGVVIVVALVMVIVKISRG